MIPTPVTWLGGDLFHSISATFEGGTYSETDGYFGVPLLLAATTLVLTRWRTQRPFASSRSCSLATIILACGATLHIGGHALIPLPWRILEHLPLLPGVAPSRIAVFAALILAAMVAIWLAGPRRHRTWRWLIITLGVAALFPNLAGAYWNSRPDNPAFFRTGEYRQYLAPGEDLLAIPFANTGNSMLWQAETGFYFTMPGGYISSTRPNAALHSAAITQFYAGSAASARIPTRYVSTIATFFHTHHVDHVALEPRYQATWHDVLARIAKTAAADRRHPPLHPRYRLHLDAAGVVDHRAAAAAAVAGRDRDAFAALNADPEVMAHFPARLSRAESDAMMDRLEAGIAADGFGLWAVEERSSGVLLGATGLNRVAFAAPFVPGGRGGLAVRAGGVGARVRDRGGRRGAVLRLRCCRAGRDRRDGRAAQRALARGDGTARDAARRGWRLRPSPVPAGPLQRHVLYRIGAAGVARANAERSRPLPGRSA